MSQDSLKDRSRHIDRIVGNNLRMIRQKARLSQQQIADELGITFQQVQKYEKGTNRIAASTMYVLSKKLGTGILDFFTGLEAKGKHTNLNFSRDELEWLRLYNELPSDDARKDIMRMMKRFAASEHTV